MNGFGLKSCSSNPTTPGEEATTGKASCATGCFLEFQNRAKTVARHNAAWATQKSSRFALLAKTSILLLALSLSHCSDEIPVLKEEGAESGSTIRISNFKREEYNALGAPEMRVKAREAYIYESGDGANKTQERLVGYDFEYTDIDGADTTILTAQKAEMNQKTGIMYMTGNVHLKGLDREIRGEALYYDMKKKIARSDQPVYIKEGEISTHCRGGVIMYMNEEKQICRLPAGKREKRKPTIPGPAGPTPGQGDDLFQ
ncbi:MAG: LPS export ABC transporter periplasmic protein LptC [Leptospiraceae bacterium]|nr:LPS export ABC transporter periplasmic protein LptC [Leptospiraceae bacterium]